MASSRKSPARRASSVAPRSRATDAAASESAMPEEMTAHGQLHGAEEFDGADDVATLAEQSPFGLRRRITVHRESGEGASRAPSADSSAEE